MKKLLLIALTMLMTLQLFAQNIVATGTVRDDKGNPVAGVSVTEKGLTNSTLTDANGNFRLSLSSGRVLVVSMSGYAKQEVRVDSNGDIGDDIVLLKPIKRVRFGLKGGVDYNYYEYKYHGETLYGSQNTELEFDDSSVGCNGGIYMDLNLSRTFSFEFGAQVYMRSSDFVSLNIPVVCKWRMGKRKQFFICWGPGLELLLKEPENHFGFNDCALSLNFSIGYEFASGIGCRVTGKPWADIVGDDNILTGAGYVAGVAFSYRF